MSAKKGSAVVVIGGGAIGLSTAWWLARSGVDVTVVEKGIVGWEASGRNGGGCTHYSSPLFREEQRLWPQMDALLGYPTEHRPFRIGIALRPEQFHRYRRMAHYAAMDGFQSTEMDAKQVRELVPLAGEGVFAGMFFHFGGHANPQRTVQAYAWAIQDLGGRILQHTTVTGFTRAAGRVTEVLTSAGPIGCDKVVLAAGPQTRLLARELGVEIPVVPGRNEMIVTEPLPLMDHGGVDGNGLYGRQTLRGNLAYGGGPHEWLDAQDPAKGPIGRPSTPLLRAIAARLAELFPKAAHARVLRSWAGIVENTPDGRPVLDTLAEPGNVTVATMSSVGFGLSPAAGRALSELVMFGACNFADLSTLKLARFDGLDPDWYRARGWVPPGPNMEAA